MKVSKEKKELEERAQEALTRDDLRMAKTIFLAEEILAEQSIFDLRKLSREEWGSLIARLGRNGDPDEVVIACEVVYEGRMKRRKGLH